MTVTKQEGAPYPGFATGAIEAQDGTVEISDSATTGTVTFTTDADFDTGPRVVYGFELESTSSSSSTTQVERAEVTSRGTDSVEITVEVDTAPGSSETSTVRVDVLLIEG